MKRLPVIPTVIVLVAAAVMVALGVWQLQRMEEKEALLAHYEEARRLSSAVPFPRDADAVPLALYRASEVDCMKVVARRSVPGRSAQGQTGLAQVVRCRLAGGGEADIALGFSVDPAPARWDGGTVSGFLAPNGREAKLVAAPPQAGLAALAQPDPSTIPNNHLAYAVQWFFFAATALVIYLLALRRRARAA